MLVQLEVPARISSGVQGRLYLPSLGLRLFEGPMSSYIGLYYYSNQML